MNRWFVFTLVATVLVLATLISSTFLVGVPVETARAGRGAIREFIDERGKTRLPQVHLTTMPYDARIEQIELVEGDPVTNGKVVARVVPSDLEDAVAEASSVVQRLEAAIRENDDTSVETTSEQQSLRFLESMVSTVAAAKTRMTSGKAKMDYAETHLGRTEQLARTGARTEDERDRAKLAHVESQVDYQQDVLIWRAMVSIEAATALLPRMVRQYITRKELTRAVLEKQKAEAQARLDLMLTRQQRGTMTSPVDGEVLERLVQNERQLSAGTILLKIGRLEELEVEADVLSQDVVDVQPGDQVEIYGPAIGKHVGDGVRGTVHRIHPAGFTKVSSLGVEQQRVKVIIRFAGDGLSRLHQPRELGVDYRVRVRIFTEEKQDTLVIPRSALFRGADNRWQVFVVQRGKVRRKSIAVGLMNDDRVEILDGLQKADRVVLAPDSSLTDGNRVKYAESD